jgi:hypothetical protein
MMARRGALGLLAGTVAALLSGCGSFFRSGSYRFRMTVEVETPEGVRTGSSVYEVTATKSPALTSEEHEGGGGLRGEAVVVDLPGGPLFVTLKMPVAGESLGAAATLALAPETRRGNVDAYVAAVDRLGGVSDGTKAELPRKQWPLMVRFRDIADPASVEEAYPDAIGVKRILLETTHDEMTRGIEKKMPTWFKEMVANKSRLNGSSSVAISTNDLADNLGAGSFSTEIGK